MIRVLLADDHTIVRQGLRALLSAEEDIEVVAEAENGRDAIEEAERHQPDVIVMDYSMPHLNGLEGTRRIVQMFPRTRIIVLSMHADEEYILQFIRAGAAGYLLKDAIATDLIQAIRQAMQSRRFICPSLSPDVLESMLDDLQAGRLQSPLESLTNREREVLQLIAEGLTNKLIARKLGISIKTVETHRAHIMNKLDIHDQVTLTRFALKHKITL